jgi:hypothetical protein
VRRLPTWIWPVGEGAKRVMVMEVLLSASLFHKRRFLSISGPKTR